MINPRNYTAKQIDGALRMKTGSRKVTFRYDLLDRRDNEIGTLDGITTARVSYGEFRVIKRTGTFRLNEYQQRNIDFLNDQIRPNFILHMPDGGTVEWSLGVFMLNAPERETTGRIKNRDFSALDKTIVIDEDRFTSRYFIEAGTSVVGAVIRILNEAGITKVNITENPAVLSGNREYPAGEKRLHAVNDLLSGINYTSIGVDAAGFMRAVPYVEPAQRPITQIYNANHESIIHPTVSESLDIAGRPNVFVRTAIDLERGIELTSTFENDDMLSPISTVNRARRIVDHQEVYNITDQETLDNATRRAGIESTSAFSHLKFNTALMPTHGRADTLLCTFPEAFDGSQKWSEMFWEMDLNQEGGGVMKHKARKVMKL